MRFNFSSTTKRIIAGRAAWKCSFPDCNAATIGPRKGLNERVTILGEAAHINGASAGGPRYDPNLAKTYVSSPLNGIWLCRHHAKLVDIEFTEYSVELLKRWKDDAERRAEQNLRNGYSSVDIIRSVRNDPNIATVACKIANYIGENLFEAHRGALLLDDGISVAFGNDGYEVGEADTRAKNEVELLRHIVAIQSIEELAFGLSESAYSWVLLFKTDNIEFLETAIWLCYPFGASNSILQREISLNASFGFIPPKIW